MRTNIVLLFSTILVVNVFGQTKTYPFEVQRTGQGNQSVIFIPGFGCSGEVWEETTSRIENNFNCYTLTMAGFAGIPAQGNPTFNFWKTSIANYIKEKDIQNPILVGHSIGGVLAMAIAGDYPELLDRVVVVDGLPCLQVLYNPAFTSEKDPDFSEIVMQMTEISDEQFYQMQKANIPRMVADTTKREKIIAWTMASDRTVFSNMYCDFANTDIREKFSYIKCPVLVMLSSGMVKFKSSIEDQYKYLKTADLQYAEKGLHFIMYDHKQWYLNKLTNFITGQ